MDTTSMSTRKKLPPHGASSSNLTREEMAELNAITDSVLKEVLGELYDPNWREQVLSPKRTHAEELELAEIERELTIPFFRQGYRLQKSTKRTGHRLGGRFQPKPPHCAICDQPLVLFANLDATDARLKGDHSLKRLPLFCCCSCPGPVHYQVNKRAGVRMLPAEAEPYDECPFTDWPRVIRSGYLSLVTISEEADHAFLKASSSEGFEALSATELGAISYVLGRKPKGRWDCYRSQIGGYPSSFQGGEGKPVICPNARCPVRRRRRDEFRYRPLAVLDLWSDRFWGHRSDALQIVYHICPGCFSISAKYSCT